MSSPKKSGLPRAQQTTPRRTKRRACCSSCCSNFRRRPRPASSRLPLLRRPGTSLTSRKHLQYLPLAHALVGDYPAQEELRSLPLRVLEDLLRSPFLLDHAVGHIKDPRG